MTAAAKKLLDTLDKLPEVERHEVFREVLRRAAPSAHESPTDGDLIEAADEVFSSLDRAESEE